MRSKETNYRDYTQKKKTKFLGNISEEPVPSKEEAAYTFTVLEERFPYWIRCLVLRYWEDLQNTFEVSWNDAVDKENVLVEHLIKISEIPTEIPEDEELSLPIINSNLYSITVYRTKNKIMAQGNYRQHWVRKEFPLLQEVINDFFSQSDQNRSIVQSYNKTFNTNLELDILDEDPVIRSYFQMTSRDPSSKNSTR